MLEILVSPISSHFYFLQPKLCNFPTALPSLALLPLACARPHDRAAISPLLSSNTHTQTHTHTHNFFSSILNILLQQKNYKGFRLDALLHIEESSPQNIQSI